MANILNYVKTLWKAGREGGTAWTPERLNNIEDGIEQATNQINTNSENIEQATNQINQINTNIEQATNQINQINNNLNALGVYSLINGVNVTSSNTNISTFQNRKISDYQMLLFTLNYNANDVRQTLIIPTGVFTVSGKQISLATNSGTYGSSTYDFNQMFVKYVNDTTISAKIESGIFKMLYIYGIKMH